MIPLLDRIASDPNLLSAAVFGGSLLGLGLIAILWTGVVQRGERKMQRRIGRVARPATAAPASRVRSSRSRASSASRPTARSSISTACSSDRCRTSPRCGSGSSAPGSRSTSATTCWSASASPRRCSSSAGWCSASAGCSRCRVRSRSASACPTSWSAGGNRRQRKFTTLLPEALDLIVRGIRSGLPASEAINTIGKEIDEPVGSEFSHVADQVKIGVNMDEALWVTARRLRIPEFNFLVISLAIQQETGGNLAEILEKLSDMVRRREQMRLKIKAMSSEARASAMIIGALPFIMAGVLTVVNPDYMTKLFIDPRGWVMIAMGFASLAVGVGVMAKMVRFEI